MVRAGREPDGRWYTGRGAGRGVWWCVGPGCVGALGVGHLARALRAPAGEGDLEALVALVNES